MAQSLSSIYIHAVFGTKYRQPLIDQRIEKKLHSYIAGLLKNINSPAIRINSMPDHLHILFRMSKGHGISEIMKLVKKDSSKWMKTQGYHDFRWQNGYGAFSVNPSQVDIVIAYIENQKEHHRNKSFSKEIDLFMKKYRVEHYSKDLFWK